MIMEIFLHTILPSLCFPLARLVIIPSEPKPLCGWSHILFSTHLTGHKIFGWRLLCKQQAVPKKIVFFIVIVTAVLTLFILSNLFDKDYTKTLCTHTHTYIYIYILCIYIFIYLLYIHIHIHTYIYIYKVQITAFSSNLNCKNLKKIPFTHMICQHSILPIFLLFSKKNLNKPH